MTDDPSQAPTDPSTTPVDGDGPPPWQPPPGPGSAATPAGSGARRGVVVPVWALLTVAGLLLLGLGFLGGWLLAPGDGDGDRAGTTFSGDLRELAPLFGRGDSDRPGTDRDATVYLGVAVQNASEPRGASVTRVAASSPASRAGLQEGDVITAVDDDSVRNATQLTRRVRAHDPGDRVTVTYTCDGASKTVEVELGSRTALLPRTLPEEERRPPF